MAKRKKSTTPTSKTRKTKKKKTLDEKERKKKILMEILKDSNVRRLIINVGGENAMEIVKLLLDYSQDEHIAEKLGVKVSDVRAVLNKFHNEGIIYYERTKDEDTGWYYYDWKIDMEKLTEWIEMKMNEKRMFLMQKLNEGEHYYCPKCGIDMVMHFDEAVDYNFHCPKCNSIMELLDEEAINKLVGEWKSYKK